MARTSRKDHLLTVIRSSKGYNRTTLAAKAQATAANMWRAESGEIISDKVAYQIADALGISSDIMFYNMGRIPPNKREFVMKDPLFFKELMDEACAEPWKLTKTKEYMDSIKEKMKVVNPDINKMLAKIKPTE